MSKDMCHVKMIQNEFKYLLNSLRYSSRKAQEYAIQEILTSIRNVSDEDLEDLFGILNSTRDMDLQVKLFSILAAHLLSTDKNNEVIITYRPIYERIQDILNSGISHRTTTTLNFVTALLSVYSDDESPSPRKKSLSLFARNMIRISGCLATMSSMFMSCMMYQDTWFALCHCLAEACRGSDINQNYCTHLVPTCVKKCQQQVNVEVCLLLQSLLHNNDRNIQVFLDNDGLTIFTRELLQDDRCMQLLNTILSKSTQAINLLRVTHVPQLLRGLVHSYGKHSKVGEWATIVLHHFDSRLRIPNPEYKLERNILEDQQNVEIFQVEKSSLDITSVRSRKRSPDETAKLFQNVINELQSWNSQSKPGVMRKPSCPFGQNEKLRFNSKVTDKYIPSIKQRVPKNYEIKNDSLKHENFNVNKGYNVSKEMSFSFIFREDFRNPSKNGDRMHSVSKPTKINVTTQTEAVRAFTKTEASGFKDIEINKTHETDQISITFAPVHSSTPKNKHSSYNKTTYSKISRISQATAQTTYRRKKRGIQKAKIREKVNTTQEIKNRSLTSRLFSAINDSCTTLVKNVTSIFKPKETFQRQKNEQETKFSINSFTNYMRRRDALLENKCSDKETTGYNEFSTEKSYVNSCRTCDNTVILKYKLANDEHLKRTLRKLKLGVNLYGCDFKKISMAIWPEEKYMTPNVLYNLYRKLIAKNIDF